MVSLPLLGTLLLLVSLAYWVMRRRKGRSQTLIPSPVGSEPEPARRIAKGSLADRLIASSELIRTALIERLGPSWAGKTTEELSTDPRLNDWLGPARAKAVLTLLSAADRTKFDLRAGESEALDPESVNAWESLATEIQEV